MLYAASLPKIAILQAYSGVIYDLKNRYKVIIVALVEHPHGDKGLACFAAVLDQIIDTIHRQSE